MKRFLTVVLTVVMGQVLFLSSVHAAGSGRLEDYTEETSGGFGTATVDYNLSDNDLFTTSSNIQLGTCYLSDGASDGVEAICTGYLGTPCEIATQALIRQSGCYQDDTKYTTVNGKKVLTNECANLYSKVCTEFIEPIPVSALSNAFRSSTTASSSDYCITSFEEKSVSKTVNVKQTQDTVVPTTIQTTELIFKLTPFHQVESLGPNAQCYGILTGTGQQEVVFTFILVVVNIVQSILVSIALVAIIGVGIFMMFPGGGNEENMKKAKSMLLRILAGLALLFGLKMLLGIISPDMFKTGVEAPTTSSTTVNPQS